MKRWAIVAVLSLGVVGAGCVPPTGTSGAPPAPSGITAGPGGGSGEVILTWDPLPSVVGVASYHVYERRFAGQYWLLAVVTGEALGTLAPGRLGVVDAPDVWPWPTGGVGIGPRCYVVSAVSTEGLEGAMSGQVCGSPP